MGVPVPDRRGSRAGQKGCEAPSAQSLRSHASEAASYMHFRTIGPSLRIGFETRSMMRPWDALHAAKQRLDELATATQTSQTAEFARQLLAMPNASLSF